MRFVFPTPVTVLHGGLWQRALAHHGKIEQIWESKNGKLIIELGIQSELNQSFNWRTKYQYHQLPFSYSVYVCSRRDWSLLFLYYPWALLYLHWIKGSSVNLFAWTEVLLLCYNRYSCGHTSQCLDFTNKSSDSPSHAYCIYSWMTFHYNYNYPLQQNYR